MIDLNEALSHITVSSDTLSSGKGFCNDLHQQINPSKEQILQLKAEYMHSINLREFDFFINSIPKSPAAFLKTIVSLLEYRLKTGTTGIQSKI
jgi:hypothetical protein